MLTKIFKKGSIVIAPDDCHEYLTAGKEYAVVESGGGNFTIIDDDGDELYCLLEGCAHIEYNDWIIKSNSND